MSALDKIAAQHALTLNDPAASGEAILAAMDWIDRQPEHRAAFDRVAHFLRACDDIDASDITEMEGGRNDHKRQRLWPMIALAASILLLIVTTAYFLVRIDQDTAPVTAHYASAPGTVRTFRLADGSNLTLSAASSVSVSFDRQERSIRLLSGEALFTVARDVKRPFVVKTDNGTATALGTAFNVRKSSFGDTVTVLHGRVEVTARGAGYVSRATLDPSMTVRYYRNGEMSTIRRMDPAMIASWRHGDIHFVGEPLGAVVDDLNRYASRPIIIDDPAIERIPVTGAISAVGIEEWLKGLPAIMPIEVIEAPGEIRLRMTKKN